MSAGFSLHRSNIKTYVAWNWSDVGSTIECTIDHLRHDTCYTTTLWWQSKTVTGNGWLDGLAKCRSPCFKIALWRHRIAERKSFETTETSWNVYSTPPVVCLGRVDRRCRRNDVEIETNRLQCDWIDVLAQFTLSFSWITYPVNTGYVLIFYLHEPWSIQSFTNVIFPVFSNIQPLWPILFVYTEWLSMLFGLICGCVVESYTLVAVRDRKQGCRGH